MPNVGQTIWILTVFINGITFLFFKPFPSSFCLYFITRFTLSSSFIVENFPLVCGRIQTYDVVICLLFVVLSTRLRRLLWRIVRRICIYSTLTWNVVTQIGGKFYTSYFCITRVINIQTNKYRMEFFYKTFYIRASISTGALANVVMTAIFFFAANFDN